MEVTSWGDKTLEQRQDTITRVNHRITSIMLQQGFNEILNGYLFDFNNEQTREVLKSELSEFMEQVKNERAIYDYMVICDETNNTPADVDNNMLNVNVMVKPLRALEFIDFNLSLGPEEVREIEIEFKCDADAYRHRLGI